MASNGESRESLDLLASAAEQSSPQSRIKRNTACVACRDSKVKCNASAAPGQPCQRCAKLKLPCVVDKAHKRVSKRSKFDELVQEVQSIKQAVAPVAQLPLPAFNPADHHHHHHQQQQQHHQHAAAAAAAAAATARLYAPPPPPLPTSSTNTTANAFAAAATPSSSSFTTPLPPRTTVPAPPPDASAATPSSTSAAGRPAPQPRALKSRVFASQDIDFYFDTYFTHFHPYLPIVRQREPDAIYHASPMLFWAIMVTACRKLAHHDPRDDESGSGNSAGGIFDFLVDAVRASVWEAVSDPPMSLPTINALLVLSAWPLPTIRFMKDPSPIYTSMLMNSCYMLGIHTGRGDFPASNYPAYRLSVSDEEAVYTWVGYNVVSQRISTYSGTPSTGQFFNKTIEGVLDRTGPVQVPVHLHILLESAVFLNRVSRTVAAHLEEGRGVSHHVVDHLLEDFGKLQRIISTESSHVSDVDHFTILSTLLETQVFYFAPVPHLSPPLYKRNALRTLTTALAVLRLAMQLHAEAAFLSHAPHFVFRSLLTATCVLISTLLSPTLKDAVEAHIAAEQTPTGNSTPDLVVAEALAATRCCSVQEGDLPLRAASMMESAWNVRTVMPPSELLSPLGASPEFSHRLGMGLPLDCIRRWKRQMEMLRGDGKVPAVPGAELGGAASAGGEAPAAAADAAVALVDWDAFMKDFDWNLEPALMDTVIPGA